LERWLGVAATTVRPGGGWQAGRRAGACSLSLGLWLVATPLPAQSPPPVASSATWSRPDWLQFGFGDRHGGVNDRETILHAGNVATLHVLYQVHLPGIVAGAPVYLSGVATAQGRQDLLYLTTQDGSILALDAATGATVWSAQPAAGPMYTTSSPAIDPSWLYVYSYGLDGMVHKYQVGDGTEITTGGWPQLATLKPGVEKSSGALATATTPAGGSYLYVVNGGYPGPDGDQGDYQGHVTTIDLASGAQQLWNTLCSDQTVHFVASGTPDCADQWAAVWARPGVVYDADVDRLFFATGNGTFNAVRGGFDWGDSILALHADGTGAGGGMPLDSYTPADYEWLDDNDLDLGSAAPVLLPAPVSCRIRHLGAHVGKDEIVRLLDLDDLSGTGAPGQVGGELGQLVLPQGGEVLSQPAVWVNPADGTTWMLIANDAGISGLQLAVDPFGAPSLTPVWTNEVGGTSPIVANGILYYNAAAVGMAGLDPVTGEVLWLDGNIGSQHWQSPIVAGGRLFIADENAVLWAYGPDPAPLGFYTVPPCRAVDTRGEAGTFAGPSLAGGAPPRPFPLAGRCGVPVDARAVAVNLTAVVPSGAGDLQVVPAGVSTGIATLTLQPGRVRATQAVVGLTGNPLGVVAASASLPAGATVDLLVDVTGYFK
jgi:outer membrane protein assembly factor BamB